MREQSLFGVIKEYNKYKSSKAISSLGVYLNTAAISAIVFTGLCFVFARISKNNVFGILLGTVAAFFVIMQAAIYLKSYLLKKLPEKKRKYYNDLKLTRLHELSHEEFTDLALRSVKLRVAETDIIKEGIFYKSENAFIVFLILPGRKELPAEKIRMALNAGAKKAVVVCRDSSEKKIREEFGDKIAAIVTDSDIIKDSPELDYEELKQKKKINFEKFCNNKNAAKLARIAALSVFLAIVSGMRAYFGGIAALCGALSIVIYFMNRRVTARR